MIRESNGHMCMRAIHPDVPIGHDLGRSAIPQGANTAWARRPRETLNEAGARQLLRSVGIMMSNEAVGPHLATQFVDELLPLLRRLLDALDLPAKQARELDPSSAIEGLVNQLVGIFHTWADPNGVCDGFLERLQLPPHRQYLHLVSGKSSAVAMCDKGDQLDGLEFNNAYQAAQQQLGPAPRTPATVGKKKGKKKKKR